MYEYIQGVVTDLSPAYAVIEAGGVGYYLVISLQTYTELENAESARVYTHFIVREDAQILYGFATKEEREVFRMLISVSGVGGNTARMVLSTYTPSELSTIISTENANLLKNVKGLGIKTAQKIIVDLKDKILGVGALPSDSFAAAATPGGAVYEEAVAALGMLGFNKGSSDKAIKAVLKDNPSASVEDVIRLALKRL